jgi:clorobiocin biosynthesis protein CloN6
MVMRGYETHGPVAGLLTALKQGVPPAGVPNLVWKNPAGEIVDNGFSHTPDSFACGVDWTSLPEASDKSLMPILELMSMQNAGCSYNCGWCGGSREAFRRIFGQTKAMARKPLDQVAYEFETMRQVSNLDSYHFYSVGSYNEPAERFRFFLERVAETNFESIAYEQFDLTPDETLKAMAKANPRNTICLSAESHDLRVAKLAGRGVYTMEQLERWIRKALDYGIHEVDIWFFIGMPEQDERSVLETVDYCGRLLKLFQGERVLPLLCPMIPFLDPASTFFERPEEHGYRVFYRTVEEHRRGMERASIINRCNYETRWLSRSDLVFGGYDAVRRLVELKGEFGSLPSRIAASVVEKITDALEWVSIVHQIDNIPDAGTRRSELEKVGPELLARNNEIFFAGVANQAMPVNREIGGRWFDELLQEHDVFLASASGAPPDAALSLRRPKRAGYPSGHHRRPHPRPA